MIPQCDSQTCEHRLFLQLLTLTSFIRGWVFVMISHVADAVVF